MKAAILLALIIGLLCSCQHRRWTEADIVHEELTIAGVSIKHTAHQKETKAEKEERHDDERERRIENLGLWVAGGCLLCCVLCVVAGVALKGWANFTGLAIAFGGCAVGGALWVESIQYIKWIAPALMAYGIAISLYRGRHFSAKEAIAWPRTKK